MLILARADIRIYVSLLSSISIYTSISKMSTICSDSPFKFLLLFCMSMVCVCVWGVMGHVSVAWIGTWNCFLWGIRISCFQCSHTLGYQLLALWKFSCLFLPPHQGVSMLVVSHPIWLCLNCRKS